MLQPLHSLSNFLCNQSINNFGSTASPGALPGGKEYAYCHGESTSTEEGRARPGYRRDRCLCLSSLYGVEHARKVRENTGTRPGGLDRSKVACLDHIIETVDIEPVTYRIKHANGILSV